MGYVAAEKKNGKTTTTGDPSEDRKYIRDIRDLSSNISRQNVQSISGSYYPYIDKVLQQREGLEK